MPKISKDDGLKNLRNAHDALGVDDCDELIVDTGLKAARSILTKIIVSAENALDAKTSKDQQPD